MKQRTLILTCLLAAPLRAQEAAETTATQPVQPCVILEQTVVRLKDGGTVTFQKIMPPPAPAPVVKAPVVLSAEEAARLAEIEAKKSAMLNISASVHAGGITVLRWSCDQKGTLQALSNVDFRLLAGLGDVETENHYYSLIMAAGEDRSELTPAQAALALTLPQEGKAAFVLINGKTALTTEEQQAAAAMEVLHHYFETNRAVLVQRHAKMEAERAARELAQRNAPPPPPRHSVIQFWPLSAEQKAALKATAGDATTSQPVTEGGAK